MASAVHSPNDLGTQKIRLQDSERLAWLCLGVLLLLGLPLFVCMPLWCDVTLYDVAAQNILDGGVHYRDVFDTNPPGAPWIHALVRSLAGRSSEAIRIFDLLVLTGIVLALVGWLRELGVTRAGCLWFTVGMALFYLFLPEASHCQRDTWMFFPSLLAVRLRCRRLARSEMSVVSRVREAILEGCFWGLGIWIKPHVLVPALVVWLVSAATIAGEGAGGVRRLVMDTLCWILGGALVGALGIAWMLASGTWGPFWDVVVHWNPHYWEVVKRETQPRYLLLFLFLPPWSLLHLVALPFALSDLIAARFWSRSRLGTAGEAQIGSSRAILAGLYLGWMAQALFLQLCHDYVHVPETILALAVITARRVPIGLLALVWLVVATFIWNIGIALAGGSSGWEQLSRSHPVLVRNLYPRWPLARKELLTLWPRCWTEGSTPQMRDRLAWLDECRIWCQLEEVADFLRSQGVKDGELVCWHDSTHPLYLMLRIKPAIRFMHVGTAMAIRERRDDIRQELLDAPDKKLVVSDLARVIWSPDAVAQEGEKGRLDLPPGLSQKQRHTFPFDQPIIFRSSDGRYLVHRIEKPIGRIDIPAAHSSDE